MIVAVWIQVCFNLLFVAALIIMHFQMGKMQERLDTHKRMFSDVWERIYRMRRNDKRD